MATALPPLDTRFTLGPTITDEQRAFLREHGFVGGYDLGRDYPERSDCMLFCVTEKRTKAEIDALVEALAEVGSQPTLPTE